MLYQNTYFFKGEYYQPTFSVGPFKWVRNNISAGSKLWFDEEILLPELFA